MNKDRKATTLEENGVGKRQQLVCVPACERKDLFKLTGFLNKHNLTYFPFIIYWEQS